jgi:myo-inositol-1(or 4)-monophosphatase
MSIAAPSIDQITDWARAAGQLTLRYLDQGSLGIAEKADNKGLVTQADLEAEALIHRHLRAHFPEHLILGEETGWSAPLEEAGRRGPVPLWLIDPLDGTNNFSKGNTYYCVSIGFGIWSDGKLQMQAGVVYHPVVDAVYAAERGKGAFLNGGRLHVSGETEFRLGTYATGIGPLKGAPLRSLVEMIFRVQSACSSTAVRINGAAALGLAQTGSGVFQGFWEPQLNPWDVAAGALIVEEAGGVVTNFRGEPFDVLKDAAILCASPRLHPTLLSLVGELPAAAQS